MSSKRELRWTDHVCVRNARAARNIQASLLATVAVLAATSARAQQDGGTVQLDTVTVSGGNSGRNNPGAAVKGDTATGPVNGYVATKSNAGTKTSTPINETPQAISVIGAQQIRDQAATTVDEATRYAPGVHSQTFGGDGRNDWFLIRGFSEQNTGYYLDGLQLLSPASAFATYKLDPWGLERIDIVRGPAAVLYGGGDPGGIINAVSKMPTFTNFGTIQSGFNNWGNVYTEFDVGGVAGANKEWSYRIDGEGHLGGTQVDHTSDDRGFIAPSLTYRPVADTSLTLLGQYQHDQTNGLNFLPYQGTVTSAPFGKIPTNLFTSNPGLDTFTRDQAMAGYRFETVVNPMLTLRSNVRYDYLSVDETTLYGDGYDGTPTATSAQLARFNFNTRPVAHQFEADNQAEFHFNTSLIQHTVLAGLDYKYYDLHDKENFDSAFSNPALVPDLNLLNPVYVSVTPSTNPFKDLKYVQNDLGLYGQEQMKIDRFTIVGAVREDLVDTDTRNLLATTAASGHFDQSTAATTGKVGLIYNFDNGLAPYASYSTSFNPLLGTNFTSGDPFAPETGQAEEVGLKYQMPTLPITATGALFNITRENVLTNTTTFVYTQTGEIRSQGGELSVTAQLPWGLKAVGSFTAYDIRDTKDTNPDFIGKIPAATPSVLSSLWLDYTIQDGYFKGLGFGAGARYVGRSYADQANTLPVPDFLLGDAAIHYERGNWRAAVNMSNIADSVYVASCANNTSCYYGDRRKTTFSVAYSW
jgi:iron complex outermembrane recepter protein